MVSKKKKKIILISIASVILVTVIAISTVFIVRKNKNNKTTDAPVAEQTTQTTDTNISNEAIADGLISSNYNGTYKFNTIKDIEFSDKLNTQEIRAIFKNKNVKDENELFDLLKQEKVTAANNGELIVIHDGNINETTGGIKNPTPIPESAGTFVGDDNLSLVTLTSTNEQYYISLNYKSKDAAIVVSEETSYDGTKLFLFKKIYSKYDKDLVLINIVYEYDLYIVEEEFNESIYDF